MVDAQKNYESQEGDLERAISLIIGLGKLGESLSEWDEDRQIMQKSEERRRDSISKNLPTILEESESKESALSTRDSPNLEDLDLVRDE